MNKIIQDGITLIFSKSGRSNDSQQCYYWGWNIEVSTNWFFSNILWCWKFLDISKAYDTAILFWIEMPSAHTVFILFETVAFEMFREINIIHIWLKSIRFIEFDSFHGTVGTPLFRTNRRSCPRFFLFFFNSKWFTCICISRKKGHSYIRTTNRHSY